jgi:hypothetical protein
MLAVARFVRAALGARPASPCAIVVSRARGFTLARAFASFVAGWMRVGVFDDLAAAEDWLVTRREDVEV